MPLQVSVIIPAYNAAATVEETVRSAFAQTLPPLEVIVVDDGSTDDTAVLARRAGASVLSTENGGVSRARNLGIDAAKGEWIAFLDADDRWLPKRLERQAAAQALVPEAQFVFCDMQRERFGHIVNARWMTERPAYHAVPKYRVNETVAAFDGRALAHYLLSENFIPTSSVLVLRDAIPSAGFHVRLRYCEDLELWLRILTTHDAAAVEEPLVAYRLHDTSASAHWESILRGDIALYERILRHTSGYPTGLDRQAKALIAPRQRMLGEHLVRTASYAKAINILSASLKRSPVPKTLVWLILACICGFPGIRQLHTILRKRHQHA